MERLHVIYLGRPPFSFRDDEEQNYSAPVSSIAADEEADRKSRSRSDVLHFGSETLIMTFLILTYLTFLINFLTLTHIDQLQFSMSKSFAVPLANTRVSHISNLPDIELNEECHHRRSRRSWQDIICG